jgi:ABC-type transport system involved in Fe-S cluster assembly fused permease/ATPase subunit
MSIVALIERFYNPNSGCLILDSVDIGELNVPWLRKNIGLVAQELVSCICVCVCMYLCVCVCMWIYEN